MAQPTIKDVINDVRAQLSEKKAVRIVDAPVLFNLSFAPSDLWRSDEEYLERNLFQVPEESFRLSVDSLKAARAEIAQSYQEEVEAIRKSLEKLGHKPDLPKWTKSKDPNVRKLFKGIQQGHDVLRLWNHIAYPIRRRGGLLFRIYAGGKPDIKAMLVDDYIRSVSLETAKSKPIELKLRRHLTYWRVLSCGLVGLLWCYALSHFDPPPFLMYLLIGGFTLWMIALIDMEKKTS